jgi:hypothetical protein
VRVRVDDRLGRVGECMLEVIRPPVREGWTCTKHRFKGEATAPARPRAHGEPRRYAGTRAPAPRGESGEARPPEPAEDLPKEIDIDMDMDEFRRVLREVITQELGIVPAEMAPKWQGGEVVLKPGREGTQERRIPIEVFFKKVVTVRDKLRLLEAKVNAHPGLSEEDKVILTSYVTGCYGSLTTWNLLFQNKEDTFVGQGGKEE